MKLSLNFKLGIGVVLLFTAVLATCFLWAPLKYRLLKSRLLSGETATRDAAVETLAENGKTAIPYLRRWLESESKALILGSCRALALMKSDAWKELLPQIEEMLDKPPSDFTHAAAAVLGKHGVKWRNDDSENRFRVLNLCLYFLREEPESWLAFKACMKLRDLNDPLTADDLINTAKSAPNMENRVMAIEALGSYTDPRAIEVLIDILKNDSDKNVRYWTARELLKSKDPCAVKTLHYALLNDTDEQVQQEAFEILRCKSEPWVIQTLSQTLGNHSSAYIRYSSAMELGRIGDPKTADALIKAFKNDKRRVRLFACEALGNLSEKRAVPLLIAELGNKKDAAMRTTAARALGNIGDHKAVKPLLRLLETDEVNSDSREAWWSYGEHNAHCDCIAIPRAAASYALGRLRAALAVEALMNTTLLKGVENHKAASSAASALGEVGDKRATATLIKAIKQSRLWTVRTSAACAVSRIEGLKSAEILINTLRSKKNWDSYTWLAVSLANLEHESADKALNELYSLDSESCAIALAWRKGGEYLASAPKKDYTNPFLRYMPGLSQARWGNVSSLTDAFDFLEPDNYMCLELEPFIRKIIAQMPTGFPEYDFRAAYATRKKQAEAIAYWHERHKNHLAWDAEKRRYYIKAESK